MIHFSCPHCGHQTEVDPSYAGRTGSCAKCGNEITVPSDAASIPLKRHGAPASNRGSGSTVWIVLAVLFVGGGMMFVAVLAVCGVMGFSRAVVAPTVMTSTTTNQRLSCTSNLKQIALAMHNYHDANGAFPPAYTVDENGKPLHSWRVLILPYLEEQLLYEEFNLEEPWDSPQNMAAAAQLPRVYQCPATATGALVTPYVVVNEPGAIFDGDQATAIRQITDGTSNTLLVIEYSLSDILWHEPRDVTLTEMPVPTGDHPDGANAALADGSVRSLPDYLPTASLKGLVTKAGRETVQLP